MKHRMLRSARAWAAACTLAAGLSPALLATAAGAQEHDHDAMNLSASPSAPQLALHGFSEATFLGQQDRISGGPDSTSSGFALGQFDLFLVSRLATNLSFLGESVFEIGENGEWGVDVERVFVKYSWSDLLHLAAGRTHTALGYWNEVFHHGALLQPTVERPEALKFEDDGGILPVHSVGLELSGGARSGNWGLNYVANLANGRGRTRDLVQGNGDLNRDKAFGLKLSLVCEREWRIEFGPAFHRDRIPADPGNPARASEIGERIAGVHLYASAHRGALLTEYYRVRHEDQGSGAVWNHDAGYAIATATQGRWQPYAGVDRLDYDEGDPFFAPDDRDLSRVLLGLRFEPGPFNAVKVEYRHEWRPGQETDAVAIQTAYSF